MTFLPIEGERVRNLEAIPVCVRRKLAECGLELEPEQWVGLPLAARRRMVVMPAEAALDRRAFASLVRWLAGTFLVDQAPPRVSVGRAPWRSSEPPTGVPDALWAELSLDGRFALLEVTDAQARRDLLAALTSPATTR